MFPPPEGRDENGNPIYGTLATIVIYLPFVGGVIAIGLSIWLAWIMWDFPWDKMIWMLAR